MQQRKINSFIRWWMTPYLPFEDIFELPLLIDRSMKAKIFFYISHWFIHPLKRRLARVYLIFLKRFFGVKVIAITGSAGKSTTTQMLKSILSLDGPTVSTKPSIDPVFNIPNTILKCSMKTKYLILEMSVEFVGEMDYYLWLASPDIGVITNIYSTHLEYFKSPAGVLKEKGKLLLHLDSKATSVINSNSKFLVDFSKKLKSEVVLSEKAEDPLDQNFNLSKSVAIKLGLSNDKIIEGIKNYKKPKHRYEEILHKSGAVIFDDSYNSNPEALLFTLEMFFRKYKSGKKIAILGDMLQLGAMNEIQHRNLGKKVANLNFDVVIGIGKSINYLLDEVKKNSQKTKVYRFENYLVAVPTVKSFTTKNTFILVKGSRSIALDKLIDAIL